MRSQRNRKEKNNKNRKIKYTTTKTYSLKKKPTPSPQPEATTQSEDIFQTESIFEPEVTPDVTVQPEDEAQQVTVQPEDEDQPEVTVQPEDEDQPEDQEVTTVQPDDIIQPKDKIQEKDIVIQDDTPQPNETLQPDDTPRSDNDGYPVFRDFQMAKVKVNELSGLRLSQNEDFVWGVGDSGDLVKFSLSIDNPNISNEYSYNDKKSGKDLEGITIYRDSEGPNKDLLVCKEPNYVLRIREEATGKYKVETLFEVEEAKDFGNDGIEGITYYKDDIVYLGSQKNTTLWKYNIKTKEKIEKILLKDVKKEITEVADIYYDYDKDRLWLLDSEIFTIFILTGDGKEYLKKYNLKEIIEDIDNPEALTVDHKNGVVWIGCDTGKTSRLYKLNFENL